MPGFNLSIRFQFDFALLLLPKERETEELLTLFSSTTYIGLNVVCAFLNISNWIRMVLDFQLLFILFERMKGMFSLCILHIYSLSCDEKFLTRFLVCFGLLSCLFMTIESNRTSLISIYDEINSY